MSGIENKYVVIIARNGEREHRRILVIIVSLSFLIVCYILEELESVCGVLIRKISRGKITMISFKMILFHALACLHYTLQDREERATKIPQDTCTLLSKNPQHLHKRKGRLIIPPLYTRKHEKASGEYSEE